VALLEEGVELAFPFGNRGWVALGAGLFEALMGACDPRIKCGYQQFLCVFWAQK